MDRIWTSDEVIILRDNYPLKTIDELLFLLPNKKEGQIKSKAKVEKIKKVNKKKREIRSYSNEDYIKCKKCLKEYKFVENMFQTNEKGITYKCCVNCINKNSRIHDYKKKYGILLDFDLYYDTFSPIQWYKWTIFEKTPNGKHLKQIPREIQTKENIAKIIRYVISDYLNINTREKIVHLTQSIINKYKIGFSKTDFILNSPYNIVNLTFPELNIKAWEMTHAPKDYWKNYDNFLDAVKSYNNSLQDLSYDVATSSCFEEKYIQITFPKLYRAKQSYYSNLSWNKISQDAGLNIIFKENEKMAYDNTILNSVQEKLLYEFIHLSLGIKDLKGIGMTRKGKFNFKHETGKYIPDFVIENIKLDKPIIIEYFGMVYDNLEKLTNKNTTTYKILSTYKERTIQKLEFYSNKEDIYFIDLYPSDLKGNFEGVKNKINRYFKNTA